MNEDWRELAARERDGLEISLLWSKSADRVMVAVVDQRLGDSFDIDVDRAHALTAFEHPFAYATSPRPPPASPSGARAPCDSRPERSTHVLSAALTEPCGPDGPLERPPPPGRSGPQRHTRMLVRHGYGVLLFDRRGEGASAGDPNTFGWHGERDLYAAADFLRSRADVDPERIGGIGLSVGGEMMIHAAAHSDAFKAIVSEGASGQSIRDGWANDGLTGESLPDASITLATALFTNDLPPPSLKSEVERIAPRAVFLVYGEKGQGGTERKPNQGFHEAAGEPKQIWEVPNGQHIAGIKTQPAEYERRVIAFFDRALLGRP